MSRPEKLSRAFFDRDTVQVARDLLGKTLVRRMPGGEELRVTVTETEAYIGRMDKACHAYGYRRTQRTETLFARPGTAYIYLIYGMYHCLNFVTEPEDEPAAVLIRGAVPLAGLEQMAQNRYGKPAAELSSSEKKRFMDGPGKLCKALSLTRNENGLDLTGDTLYLLDAPPAEHILAGPRIGIDYAEEAVDFPWRFRIER